MLPKLRGVDQWQPEGGAAQFAKLEPNVQRNILGPGRFEAYRAGALKLEDVAGYSHSEEWGRSLRVKSLKEMVGVENARSWIRQAKNPQLSAPVFIQVPEFESVVAAERWAKEVLGANVDFAGQHQIAEVTNRALTILSERGYDLPDVEVNAVKFDEARTLYHEKFGREATATPAMYWQGKVFVNPDDSYWQAPEAFARELAEQKMWSTGEAEHVIWHEAAHVHHERRFPALWRRLGEFTAEQADIARRVSKYAADGPKEFVAEVFAAMIAGKAPLEDQEVARLFRQWGW